MIFLRGSSPQSPAGGKFAIIRPHPFQAPVHVHHRRYFYCPSCYESIAILYQDEHLLLINKPAGLLSLSGKNPQNLDSVHHRLVQQFPGCTLVHRLDFGTSGLMVVAKNKTINAALSHQFSQRSVTRYTAPCCAGISMRMKAPSMPPLPRSGALSAHGHLRHQRQSLPVPATG